MVLIDLKIEFQPIPSLPRLAWCACLRKKEEIVRILHGPWVETFEDCFFEGAWDATFETCRFDEAIVMAGSGGRIVDGGIIFVSPGSMSEMLYSLHLGYELYVSNSFTFLLTQAGKDLDMNNPYYVYDFVKHLQAGIRKKKKRIRIQGDRYVYLHYYCNIMVKSDLTIARIEKNFGDSPVNFNDYVTFLERTIKKIFENAMDNKRKQKYRPVTTMSQGYDSTAVSVLAGRAGCREAVTFRKSISDDGYVDDFGTTSAGYLGLKTTEYERLDFNKLPGMPTAEFYLNPFACAEAMAVMENQVAGSMLITGVWGDTVWTMEKDKVWSQLQVPHDFDINLDFRMVEFRLRVGFILLAPATFGAIHRPAIYRITVSEEMKPWSVGGGYDRPIPRRIAEEGGVPRELFGQRKMKNVHFGLFSEEGDRDFEDFYQNKVARNRREHKLFRYGHRVQTNIFHWLLSRGLRDRLHPTLYRTVRFFIGYRLHYKWGSKQVYRFHWGFERTRQRYQSALGITQR